MFDEDKWEINAEATNWIEGNFDILQKSRMIGGKPNNGDIYGYSAWIDNEGIVSLRNPSDVQKSITVTYDRLIGVNEGTDNLYGKVVIGDVAKYQNNEVMKYGKTVTYTLKPKETLIMQYGAKDTQSAAIDSVHADGKVLEVEFNEAIRTPENNTISVEGNSVESIALKEDMRTVKVTLKNEIADTADFKVIVNGIKDTVGNITNTETIDDYYKDGLVTSIVNRNLNGTAINKGNDYSIDGKEGFSISGIIKTDSKNAQIVRQEGSYTLAIDNEGYLNFSLNGVTVNSKYTEKTIVDGNVKETVKGLISDGKDHQFTAVKEINGMLKLYIDGKLVASEFDETKANPSIEKNNVIFGDKLTGYVNYVTVLDKALAFDEVKDLAPSYENVVARSNNSNVKVSAYDVTASTTVTEKTDRPFSHLNDGNKSYTSNYMELTDTSDRTRHSRYVQIDLGAEFEIDKLHMTRYADGRTYGPTVIALSNDANFATKNIAYNSDTTGNVHKLGVGKDTLYSETTAGKEIKLSAPVKARYIRIYVNGNQNGATSDHIVEFEAYGKNNVKVDSLYRNE